MIYRRVLRPALFNVAGRDAEAIHERVLGMLARVSASPTLTPDLARFAAVTWPGDPGNPTSDLWSALSSPHRAGGGLR